MAYIYKIENNINGKIYIGKTEQTIEKRFQQHCSDSKRESCGNRPLYAAMNKYGIEHFHISLIEETSNPDERECYWIEQYKSFKYGYNATIGGDGKRYLDYDLILKTYSKTNNCAETARILDISSDSVRKVLQSYCIEIKDSYSVLKEKCSKIVGMYDLSSQQLIKVFSSATEAAKYLQQIKITQAKAINGIIIHIANVCNKKRKSAYGYYWEYL